MPEQRCCCGLPLHYTDLAAAAYVRTQVHLQGEFVTVSVGGASYRVPRHYIALHGLYAGDVPALAVRYGWARC